LPDYNLPISQKFTVNSMYIWLSLKLIRYPIAVVSISIGLFICLKNYKSMSVKTKR